MLPTTSEPHAGRALRVARAGAGPPLVLLHGYPDNLQIFGALAQRLAGRFGVVAFDWPGLGESEAWPGGTTPQEQARRLAALLDAWGLARVTLVGHDMGGQPALALAAQEPGRVERLVVMNSLVIPDAETSWEIGVLRRYRWNEWLIRRFPRLVLRRAESTSLPPGTRLPRDLRDDLWRSFRRPEVRRFVSRMCGGYQGALKRLPELYARVPCPTLVLWGARDRHFPPAHALRLHELIAGSTLELLADGEHWMAWHAADEIAVRIARWCEAGQ